MSTRTNTSFSVLILSAIVLAGNVASAQNWSGDPTVNNPIAVLNGGQDYALNDEPVVGDSSGGAVMAWVDMRSGSSNDIFAQRIGADGGVKWGPNGIIICDAAWDQNQPRLAAESGGYTFIVWQDFRNGMDTDIYVQKVSGTGTILWTANGVGVCTAAGFQQNPRIIPDNNGGCIVTWEDYRNYGTTGVDIFAMRLDSGGTALWAADGVPVSQAINDQTNPRIIGDMTVGGSLIVWQDIRNGYGNSDICVQRMNPGGAPAAGWTLDGNPVCTALADQVNPVLVGDGYGGAIFAWEDYRDYATMGVDVYANRIDSAGALATGWPGNGLFVGSTNGDQDEPRIASDGGTDAIIVWESDQSGNEDIYAEKVLGTGSRSWGVGAGIPICADPAWQQSPEIIPDSNGATIVWQDQRNGLDDIYAFKVNSATGIKVWPSADGSMPVSNAPNIQQIPKPVKDGVGGVIVVWVDLRNGMDSDLFAQRLLSNGSMPGPLSGWNLSSGPTPVLDAASGNPAGSLNPNGNISFDGEALTTIFFNWLSLNGLAIEADIQVPLGTPNNSAWVGIDWNTANNQMFSGTGFTVDRSSGRYNCYFNGTSLFNQLVDANYHNYRLVIRSTDFKVEYYVDGVLQTTSAVSLNSASYNDRPVTVGGRSANGPARIDNVRVKTLGGVPLFQDSFNVGGPPAAPTFMNQSHTTGMYAIGVGNGTDETQIDLSAMANDGEIGDTFKIQFEVRPVGIPFASPANVNVDNVVFFETGSSVSNAAETLSATITGLSNGPFHWQCRAIDSAGNATIWVGFGGNIDNPPTSPADTDFFVDTMAPDTVITGGPPPTGNTPSATFTFTSTESGWFERDLDGGGWMSLYSPETLTGLSNGPHTYLVRAVDPSGNVDPTPASWSWTVDTIVPLQSTLILDPASDTGYSNGDNVTSINTPTLIGMADPGATIIIYQDGNPLTSVMANVLGTFAVTVPALPDGPVGFTAVAIDAAANIGPPSALLSLWIDTIPPGAGFVNDGAGPDIDFQTDLTVLESNWGGFFDAAGVAWFEWALGTTPGGTDILPFTVVGMTNAGYLSGLSLTPGATYYATVRAVDYVGLLSPLATSNGVLTAPLAPPPILASPANLVAISGDGRITLTWDPVAGAAWYLVYYGDAISITTGTDAAEGPSPVTVYGNALTLTGLTNLTTSYVGVTAVDAFGMESDPSNIVFATPGGTSPFTFVRTLPGGSTPDVYRMISFPMIASDVDPMTNLFDDLGPYDPTEWRMFAFNPVDGLYHEFGDPAFPPPLPGHAYWIITRGPAMIDIDGVPVDPSGDFVLYLQPGWNMIGDPMPFPVDWDEVFVNGIRIGDPGDNGYVGEFLWDWIGGYVQVPQLVPSRGYWVYNRSTSPVELSIPPIATPPWPIDHNAKSGGTTVQELRTTGDDIPPPPPGAQGAGGSGGGGGGGGCFIAAAGSEQSDGRPVVALLLMSLGTAAYFLARFIHEQREKQRRSVFLFSRIITIRDLSGLGRGKKAHSRHGKAVT